MQVATDSSREVMSYCKEEGKDRIIFVTKEDHEKPSTMAETILREDDDDDEPGLINEDGSINWNCPCLGGMASGPCGPEFREAFTCFHYSTEEPKGADCFESFRAMQDCMAQYPTLYEPDRDYEDEEMFPGEEERDSKKPQQDSESGQSDSKDKSRSSKSAQDTAS